MLYFWHHTQSALSWMRGTRRTLWHSENCWCSHMITQSWLKCDPGSSISGIRAVILTFPLPAPTWRQWVSLSWLSWYLGSSNFRWPIWPRLLVSEVSDSDPDPVKHTGCIRLSDWVILWRKQIAHLHKIFMDAFPQFSTGTLGVLQMMVD